MEKVDFSPLKETLNNILMQLAIWLGISAIAYIVVYVILRLIKVPEKVRHFISVIAFLVIMYYMLTNSYVPGITGD